MTTAGVWDAMLQIGVRDSELETQVTDNGCGRSERWKSETANTGHGNKKAVQRECAGFQPAANCGGLEVTGSFNMAD